MSSEIGIDLFDVFKDEVSQAVDAVAHAVDDAGDAIKSVPLIGGLLGAAWSGLTSPAHIAQDIKNGVPIDEVVMNQFDREIGNAKTAAPYAQAVISLVPGIGPVASGAISAGIALANGQPIDEILIEGVKGAIPGGPLVGAAFDAAVGVIKGKPVEEIGLSVVEGIGKAAGVPVPPIAEKSLAAGLQVAKGVASGQSVDSALVNEAIAQLPPGTREAAEQARNVANGAPLADILMNHGLDEVAKKLSGANPRFGFDPVLSPKLGAMTLVRGVKAKTDTRLLKTSNTLELASSKRAKEIRKQLEDAMKAGIAMGTGAYFQAEGVKRFGAALPQYEAIGAAMNAASPVLSAAEQAVAPPKPKLNLGVGLSRKQMAGRMTGVIRETDLKQKLTLTAPAATRFASKLQFADDFPYGDKLWQEGEGFAGVGGTTETPHESLIKGFRLGTVAFNQNKVLPKQKLNLGIIRRALPPTAQQGFDAAIAINRGGPAPEGLSPAQAAGFLAVQGMTPGASAQNEGIAEVLIDNEETKEGVREGLRQKSIWERILEFFGLR